MVGSRGVDSAGNLAGQEWLGWAGVALLAALVAVGIWQRRIDLEVLASLPLFSAYAAPLGLLLVGTVLSVLLLETSLDFLAAALLVGATITSAFWIVLSTRRLYRLWKERNRQNIHA